MTWRWYYWIFWSFETILLMHYMWKQLSDQNCLGVMDIALYHYSSRTDNLNCFFFFFSVVTCSVFPKGPYSENHQVKSVAHYSKYQNYSLFVYAVISITLFVLSLSIHELLEILDWDFNFVYQVLLTCNTWEWRFLLTELSVIIFHVPPKYFVLFPRNIFEKVVKYWTLTIPENF